MNTDAVIATEALRNWSYLSGHSSPAPSAKVKRWSGSSRFLALQEIVRESKLGADAGAPRAPAGATKHVIS